MTDEPFWNDLRTLADDCRLRTWRLEMWKPRPALLSRDGFTAQPFGGQSYDRDQWRPKEQGWDHDHCQFCWADICDKRIEGHEFEAYTDNGQSWLCRRCHDRIVASGEDPEVVLREEGWR